MESYQINHEKKIRTVMKNCADHMQGIVSKAEEEDRDLTKEEIRDFDEKMALHTEQKKKLEKYQKGSDMSLARQASLPSGKANDTNVEYWKSLNKESHGEPIPVLSRGAKLYDQVKGDKSLTVEDYFIDRARGFAQKRAMDTGADSAMVPEHISAKIIDEARSISRIFQAGAMVVPMGTKTLTVARITQSASPEWKAENDPHTASDILTEPVTFTAKTLIGSVKSSVELSEDAENLASVVSGNLAQQLALELDRVALFGTGTNEEPTGLFHAANVQEEDMGTDGAELTSYAPFSQAYQNILAANGQPNATIFSPRTWGTIDRLTASDNQPLQAPMSFQNLAKLPTSQVPDDLTHGTATDASSAFVGDFSQLMVGIRTNLTIEVSRQAADQNGSAWENLQLWWRAYLRADIQLMHPDHFCLINGIIPAS